MKIKGIKQINNKFRVNVKLCYILTNSKFVYDMFVNSYVKDNPSRLVRELGFVIDVFYSDEEDSKYMFELSNRKYSKSIDKFIHKMTDISELEAVYNTFKSYYENRSYYEKIEVRIKYTGTDKTDTYSKFKKYFDKSILHKKVTRFVTEVQDE